MNADRDRGGTWLPEGQVGFWSDEEVDAWKKRNEHETNLFLEEVKSSLDSVGSIGIDQFDQIADQIEKTAPTVKAAYAGIRALGKHFIEHLVEGGIES